MIRVAVLLVIAFFAGRICCPHCARAVGLVRVANRDRDLYLAECRHYAERDRS